MGRSTNTLKASDVTVTPIKTKYSQSFYIGDLPGANINYYVGQNGSLSKDGSYGPGFLTYRSALQLYYVSWVSGSQLGTGSSWDNSLQSTAASGTFDDDYRYFPTGSSDQIIVYSIPREVYGEQISRGTFRMQSVDAGSHYNVIDDGNGNLIDTVNANAHVGNILYAQGMVIVTNPSYLTSFVTSVDTTVTFRLVSNAFEYIQAYAVSLDSLSPPYTQLITNGSSLFPNLNITGSTQILCSYYGLYRIGTVFQSTYQPNYNTGLYGCDVSMSDSSGNQSHYLLMQGSTTYNSSNITSPTVAGASWGSNATSPSAINYTVIPSNVPISSSNTYLDIYSNGITTWAKGTISIVSSTGTPIFSIGYAAAAANNHNVFSSSYDSNAPYKLLASSIGGASSNPSMSVSIMDLSSSLAETYVIASGSSIILGNPINSHGWGKRTALPSYISIRLNSISTPSYADVFAFNTSAIQYLAYPPYPTSINLQCTSVNSSGVPTTNANKAIDFNKITIMPYTYDVVETMNIKVSGVTELVVQFQYAYRDAPFKYRDSAGVYHNGNFVAGNINF